MPVKKDENGRRYVQAEVEVPGSPEDVWRAIATGDGISSWFVPTTSDQRVGGRVVCSFGPGMDSVANITEWDPPRRFSAETEEGPGTVATEWIVESRGGGTCVVRVVHRWFADTDDWDSQFEGHAYGWATTFFRILRLYLTHFAGQPCSPFDLSALSKASPADTWRTLKSAVLVDGNAGRAVAAPGAPELSGVTENAVITDPELLRARERAPLVRATLEGANGEQPELLLRLDRPAPGLAHMFVMPMGDQTLVSVRFFLYGDEAAAVAPDAKRAWSDWLAARFGDSPHS